MRISRAILAAAFLFVALSAAHAIPQVDWLFPADQRLIYQIDTSGLTSEYNVYVELNIPESAYSTLIPELNDSSICWYLDHNAVHELWPRIYYFSDVNIDQRQVPPYAVLDSYTYDVPQCGISATINLPKAIRVYLSQLDTYAGEFNTFNHYLSVYVPGSVRMFSFVYSKDNVFGIRFNGAITSLAWYPGPVYANQYTPFGVIGSSDYFLAAVAVKDLNIPLVDVRHVFVYARCWGDLGFVSLLLYFEGSDGKMYAIGAKYQTFDLSYAAPYDEWYDVVIPCNTYTDISPLLSQYSGKDIQFFRELRHMFIALYATSPYNTRFDDILIITR